MAITKAALKSEIQNDPNALGYAPFSAASDWDSIAALLNDRSKGGQINVAVLDARSLVNAVVAAEYNALTQPARDLWRDILTVGATQGVRLNDSGIVALVLAVWSAGTTRTNLVALQKRAGSRCEALFGEATAVNAQDVFNAVTT